MHSGSTLYNDKSYYGGGMYLDKSTGGGGFFRKMSGLMNIGSSGGAGSQHGRGDSQHGKGAGGSQHGRNYSLDKSVKAKTGPGVDRSVRFSVDSSPAPTSPNPLSLAEQRLAVSFVDSEVADQSGGRTMVKGKHGSSSALAALEEAGYVAAAAAGSDSKPGTEAEEQSGHLPSINEAMATPPSFTPAVQESISSSLPLFSPGGAHGIRHQENLRLVLGVLSQVKVAADVADVADVAGC